MSQVYILTCVTNPYQFESVNLISIGKKLGYNVVLCGVDTKWKGFVSKIENYNSKLSELDNERLCVLLDGYDVLPVKQADGLEKEFNSIKKAIVVGAENYCFPTSCLALKEYFKVNATGKFNYANAGMMMGKVKDLKKMYEIMLRDNEDANDQVTLCKYIEKNVSDFYLDVDAKIFFNSVYIDNHPVNTDCVIPEETINGKNQYFIHFPGMNIHLDQAKNYQNVLLKVLDRLNMKSVISMRPTRALTSSGVFFLLCLTVWSMLATVFALYYYFRSKRS